MTITYNKQVLLKRGNAAFSSTYVGPISELTYDTDLKAIRVHDGVTPGGEMMPTATQYAEIIANVNPFLANISVIETDISTLYANAEIQAGLIANIVIPPTYSNVNVESFLITNNYVTDSYVTSAIGNIVIPPTYSNVNVESYLTTGISANIIPSVDNSYSLGSSQLRWHSVYIGPGTVYLQDKNNPSLDGTLSVIDEVLHIDGASKLQVGRLQFNDNTIISTIGNVDIQIGSLSDTGNITLNRNTVIASGKHLQFPDGTRQTTAPTSYCGSFYSTETQVVTANRDSNNYPVSPVNPQKTAFTYNVTDTDSTNGISVVNNSQITFAHAGTYNIAFSAQLRNFYSTGGAQNSNVAIWLAKNGSDIPWTATWVYYDKYDKKNVEAWNFFVTVNAGDYCELMWWDENGNTEALVEQATTTPVNIPAIPSIILTVNQVK